MFSVPENSCRAEVAELADALASGASGRKAMKVRVLSSAPLDSPASRAPSWQARAQRALQWCHVERNEFEGPAPRTYPSQRSFLLWVTADDAIVVGRLGSTSFDAATTRFTWVIPTTWPRAAMASSRIWRPPHRVYYFLSTWFSKKSIPRCYRPSGGSGKSNAGVERRRRHLLEAILPNLND